MNRPCSSQSGNVIFYVLLAVVLFAALSMVFMQSARQGSDTISEEQTEIFVSEILEYSATITTAVKALRLRGCREREISFESAPFDGSDPDYTNSFAPSDFSCHVFHPSGGGVGRPSPAQGLFDQTHSGEEYFSEYFFTGFTCLNFVGDTSSSCGTGGGADAELMMFLPYIREPICAELNRRLQLDNDGDITADTGNAWEPAGRNATFSGVYGTGLPADTEVLAESTAPFNLEGALSGCFEGGNVPASGTYHYFQVMLPR